MLLSKCKECSVTKSHAISLLLIWGLIQSFLLYSNGINTSGEFLRFSQEANHLLHHEKFTTPIYFMYSIQIILIYVKIISGSTYTFIIILQLLLNVIALFYFYKLIIHFYSSKKIALIGSILLIICIPYQIYNTYIYTESIFFSLTIIYSSFLLRATSLNRKNILMILAWLLLLCITRPTGIFFLGASAIYLFYKSTPNGSSASRLLILLTLTAIGLWVLNEMMKSGEGVNVLLPFKEEHIICDVRTVINPVEKNEISDSSFYSLLHYILTHKLQFLKLASLRTLAFFGLMRSYYSTLHNIFTAGFFYILYALAIYGIFVTIKKFELLKCYILTVIGIFWMAVVFSCDEWHSRFFLTLTPFIIMLALLPFYKKETI